MEVESYKNISKIEDEKQYKDSEGKEWKVQEHNILWWFFEVKDKMLIYKGSYRWEDSKTIQTNHCNFLLKTARSGVYSYER